MSGAPAAGRPGNPAGIRHLRQHDRGDQELRIRFYEEELQKQQYRLQYYQLQLKPHFYLNSLKSLYGLAQNGKNEEIQKMLSLSEQFQYMPTT